MGLLDAAFTSVSAVCVTGLVVLDTPNAFGPVGQGILLLLIQVGGLGIMTMSSLAVVPLKDIMAQVWKFLIPLVLVLLLLVLFPSLVLWLPRLAGYGG